MRFITAVLSLLVFLVTPSWGQLNVNITTIDSLVTCANPCKVIKANHPDIRTSSDYVLTTIPYQSISLSSPTTIPLGDDDFSAPIPMGFTFCFYGVPYSNCVVGSNGLVTFNTAYANTPCFSDPTISLPFNNGTFPQQVIAMPFMDVDPSQGGTISYQTIGTAPYRKFIIRFSNVPLFGATSTVLNNFYTVLSETYNTIEIHIGNKGITSSTTSTALDSAVCGIQNGPSLLWVTPPNKNGGVWTSINEAWKFTPNGPQNYVVEWLVNGAVQATKNDSANLCFSVGTNTVVCRYVSNCPSFSISDTFIVKNPPLNIDSIKIIQPICKYNKGSVVTSASTFYPPISYRIDGGAWQASNTFANLPLKASDYTIEVKDAGGCAATTSFLLIAVSNLLTSPDSIIDASCTVSNGSACVAINNGIPPYSILWSTGQTTKCLANLSANTGYTCTVTDSLNCVDSVNIFINTIKPVINIDSIKKPVCPSGTGYIQLSGSIGVGPYIFIWQPGGDTASAKGNLAGNSNYTVTCFDALGCSTTKIIPLNYVSNLTVQFTGTKPTCKKSNGSITATVSNGPPPYIFTWTGTTQTTATITGLDSNMYYLTVKDADGCQTTGQYYLIDTLVMSLTPTKVNTTCGYPNGSINIGVTNAAFPCSYIWTPTAPNQSNLTNLAPGSYSVTVTDILQCVRTTVLNIASSSYVTLQFSSVNPYCDSANGSVLVSPTSGAGNYTYAWTNGPNTAAWNNILGGTYTVLVKDGNNCTTTGSLTIIDKGSPQLQVVNYFPPLCHGDSSGQVQVLGLGGSSPYKYSIDGTNFFTSALITNFYAGTYTFYIRDATSCTKDTVLFFPEPTKINLQIDLKDTLICYYDKIPVINFPASGGYPPYKYKLDNELYGLSSKAIDVGIGSHKIYVLDSVGCERVFPLEVVGPKNPFALQIIPKPEDCLQPYTGAIELIANGGWGNYSYQWSNGITTAKNDSLRAGKYSFIAIDGKGCKEENEIALLKDTCCIATLPSAFSPNNDYINDDIGIIATTPLESVELRIYNRWGKLLFESTDINARWDARKGNSYLDPDVYFYLLQFKCSYSNQIFISKGDIVIMK